MLASLQRKLRLGLARDALESEHDLLGRLGLLVENRLGLTSVSGLLAVVTTLSLGEERCFSGLVLCHFVLGVLLAVAAFAVCAAGLGDVDLWGCLLVFC